VLHDAALEELLLFVRALGLERFEVEIDFVRHGYLLLR
jgi:hypothetical protein